MASALNSINKGKAKVLNAQSRELMDLPRITITLATQEILPFILQRESGKSRAGTLVFMW